MILTKNWIPISVDNLVVVLKNTEWFYATEGWKVIGGITKLHNTREWKTKKFTTRSVDVRGRVLLIGEVKMEPITEVHYS